VAAFVAASQPMRVANIRKILEEDSNNAIAPKVSFLGGRKQRQVTYEELAYIVDSSQPKPANGLNNLFIADGAATYKEGEEAPTETAAPKEAKKDAGSADAAKPISKVKDLVHNAVKDATDPSKRKDKSSQAKLSLPIMCLLLAPSIAYYGINHSLTASVAFFVLLAYILNYVLVIHLGESTIRTSNNDMGQLGSGSMNVKFPVYTDKLRRYLNNKREESGIEINFTHVALKSISAALSDYKQMHGHVMLGEFFPSKTAGVDVSLTLDLNNNESATVKVTDVNLKGVDYLADELCKRQELLKAGPSLTHSRKARLLSLLPHFVRHGVEMLLSFLGSQCALNLPALGVVAHPLGAATLVTSQLKGESDADTEMTMVPVMSGYNSAPITVSLGGVKIVSSMTQDGVLSGVPALVVSVTVDTKAGTLVEARRFCNQLQQYMNDPALLDKVDRKNAVAVEDQKQAAARAIKQANKFKMEEKK
jgi:hypothetical protein